MTDQESELSRLRAEVEKYRGGMPTHADGCWSWGWRHYECAEREIARLRARVAELESDEPVADDCRELIREYRERAAKANENAGDAEEDAYNMGTRDGFHDAVQLFDLATGGDGEFKGSSEPGETVDVPVMIRRIVARLTRPNESAEPRGLPDPMPEELFDSYSVLNELTVYEQRRTSAENVTDVLNATVRLIRRRLDAITHADEGKKG